MLDVCGSWAAAIEAAPALWPTAVLALAPSALNEFELRKDEYATRDRSLTICPAVDKVFDAIDSDHNAAISMVERAAALSPRCRRVRVQGDERVKVSNMNGLHLAAMCMMGTADLVAGLGCSLKALL